MTTTDRLGLEFAQLNEAAKDASEDVSRDVQEMIREGDRAPTHESRGTTGFSEGRSTGS